MASGALLPVALDSPLLPPGRSTPVRPAMTNGSLGDPVRTFAGQEGDGSWRIEHGDRRIREPRGIAGDEHLASGCIRGARADGVLEVRPCQRQRAADDGSIHTGDAEGRNDAFHRPPGGCGVSFASQQVEDGSEPVRGYQRLDPFYDSHRT